MIMLRDYQEDARVDLRVALRSSTAVLLVLATGAGKTVLAAALMQALFKAGKKVIFACHRKELLKQTAVTLGKFGIPFSYIASGHHFNPLHRIWIASIATLKNRLGKIPADYLFVDEAHLSMAAGWNAVVSHYKSTGTKVIGLTATAERLDGKPLGENFDKMVLGPSVAEMIERGNLSSYKAYAPSGIDLSGIKTRGGDYVSSDLDALMSGKAVMRDAVKHWTKYSNGRRTIAFCVSVKRAQDLAEEFNQSGITAVAISGETDLSVRNKAFADFADRKIKVITSVNLFNEGFDIAAQVGRDVTVEAVLLHRPTQSLAMHLQQVGRALRKKDYPAIILDLVANISRLGLPDDDREWSLEGRKKVAREVKAITCDVCFATHAPAPVCPECGTEYPKKEVAAGGGRKIEEVDHDLEEIDVAQKRRAAALEDFQADTLEKLVALGERRGYKYPKQWAAHKWTARMARGAAV